MKIGKEKHEQILMSTKKSLEKEGKVSRGGTLFGPSGESWGALSEGGVQEELGGTDRKKGRLKVSL